jgi:uncharacterized membrane protein
MPEQSPVGGPTNPAPDDDEIDYGKGIYDRLGELNERLKGWDGLLTQETNTETSSDPATPDSMTSGEMPTRASSETTNPPAASPTSDSGSPAAQAADSSSDPTVDPKPVPNRAAEAKQQTSRKSLGFLGKSKRRPNP